MKRAFLVFLFLCIQGHSQTLALHDLIGLQSKPHTEIRQQLIDTKWKLVDERFSEKRNFGDMTFTSTEKPGPKTMRLKVFYGQGKKEQTRLQLKLKDTEQFSAIKSGFSTGDLRFASTEVNGNTTTTVFKNDTLTVTILASRPVGNVAEYEINVVSNAYDPKMYNFSIGE